MQRWPDLPAASSEIHRVLKPGGTPQVMFGCNRLKEARPVQADKPFNISSYGWEMMDTAMLHYEPRAWRLSDVGRKEIKELALIIAWRSLEGVSP